MELPRVKFLKSIVNVSTTSQIYNLTIKFLKNILSVSIVTCLKYWFYVLNLMQKDYAWSAHHYWWPPFIFEICLKHRQFEKIMDAENKMRLLRAAPWEKYSGREWSDAFNEINGKNEIRWYIKKRMMIIDRSLLATKRLSNSK